jgi:hypothetical protein
MMLARKRQLLAIAQRESGGWIMGIRGYFILALLLAALPGYAQAPADAGSLIVKGVVAGPKGPLANAIVVLSPIETKSGLAATVYNPPGTPGAGDSANPKITADANGAFTAKFPRRLFAGGTSLTFRPDELNVAVLPDARAPKGPFYEGANVKFDAKAPTVDLGKVTLSVMQ